MACQTKGRAKPSRKNQPVERKRNLKGEGGELSRKCGGTTIFNTKDKMAKKTVLRERGGTQKEG